MKLSQFSLPINSQIEVEGEYEGNTESGKVVIFSHGFGVTRDSHGMFVELGDLLKEEHLIVRFDYTKINKDDNTQFAYPYSAQKLMLEAVVDYIRQEFTPNKVDIIAHSQGCITTAMISPEGIHTAILNAPPVLPPCQRMKEYFSQRKETVINEEGLSYIARSDGSTTLIPEEFWREMREVKPLRMYKELATNSHCFIIHSWSDQVVLDDYTPIRSMKDIVYIELPGNHDFDPPHREQWLKTNANIIKGEGNNGY